MVSTVGVCSPSKLITNSAVSALITTELFRTLLVMGKQNGLIDLLYEQDGFKKERSKDRF